MTLNSDFLPPNIERNDASFIITSRTLETSMPGVFADDDVRTGSTNQAASAAREGATAALMIRSYLRNKAGSWSIQRDHSRSHEHTHSHGVPSGSTEQARAVTS